MADEDKKSKLEMIFCLVGAGFAALLMGYIHGVTAGKGIEIEVIFAVIAMVFGVGSLIVNAKSRTSTAILSFMGGIALGIFFVQIMRLSEALPTGQTCLAIISIIAGIAGMLSMGLVLVKKHLIKT